ncbi:MULTISPECIES: hypothetical protein [Calothrix]|uniref:Uncharacterized protein n=2 Tax=Calothrix TaxID=1186 RepID=A0ABR8ACV0_9CYAN|nr:MULTISPECIES: hypothetical protein [Calothrix]MBD2197728.1 hypothetical protein [Calothrix parietina FACHB-288]MBD2225657.1 hypothetical protein [Calothrix anomala FACHB-343]
MSYVSQICKYGGKILLMFALVSLPLPALSENQQVNSSAEFELQTQISDRDGKIIELLVAIALSQSSQVREAKAAMGWSAFTDVLTVELSPSQTTTNYNLPEILSESERSFGISITIDPIRLLNVINELPIRQARWHETKQQKRLAVIQYYLAYLQAQQATKIAAYRMQQITPTVGKTERIASVNSQVTVAQPVSLANPEYVAAATEMLNTNARERLALEELAACIGLSSQATLRLINELK